jgi:hypothetical protein
MLTAQQPKVQLGLNHGLINYKDTKTNVVFTVVNIYLWTGDTVIHVGIFDPAL